MEDLQLRDTDSPGDFQSSASNNVHVKKISLRSGNVILLILFGLSSWIAINGLWMELPSLTGSLPEGWGLPAYLSVIIQLSNIGPVVYVLLTRLCKSLGRGSNVGGIRRLIQPPERLANYLILSFGLLAGIFLMYFWDKTVQMPWLPVNYVPGGVKSAALYEHSLGLFVLTFAFGVIDCMSSVTFLAYLANMPAIYAGALLFGETASGLLPALYAVIQGAIAEPICVQKIDNTTVTFTAEYAPLRFGVPTFFGLLVGTTGVSLLAFLLLDCLPTGLGRSVTLAYLRQHSVPDENEDQESDKLHKPVEADGLGEKGLFWFCFVLMGYTSCLTNGLLPSMQSYSTLCYDYQTFHLTLTISGITATLVALVVTAVYGYGYLGVWLRSLFCCGRKSPVSEESGSKGEPSEPSVMASIVGKRLACALILLSVIGSLFGVYIIYLASSSPNPPQLGGFGPAVSVLTWVLMTATFGIQKTWITLHLVRHGSQHNLRILGIANQFGSMCGALISFLVITYFKLFVSKPPCS